MVPLNVTLTGKTENYLHYGLSNLQNAINKTQPMVIFIVQKESSNFVKGVLLIEEKVVKTEYSLRFIKSVVNEFKKCKECKAESFIIPTSWFEIKKSFKYIEIPYCDQIS